MTCHRRKNYEQHETYTTSSLSRPFIVGDRSQDSICTCVPDSVMRDLLCWHCVPLLRNTHVCVLLGDTLQWLSEGVAQSSFSSQTCCKRLSSSQVLWNTIRHSYRCFFSISIISHYPPGKTQPPVLGLKESHCFPDWLYNVLKVSCNKFNNPFVHSATIILLAVLDL